MNRLLSAGRDLLPGRLTTSGLVVRELDVGAMHGRDRNRACPCKSGRKWKRCHGRTA